MIIKGHGLSIRAIEQSDLAQLHRWSNDPETQRMLGGWHFPVGIQDQQRWFDGLRFDSQNQRLAVEEDGKGIIGTTNLVGLDWQNRVAFHGLMLGPESRGRGLGVRVLNMVMRYAFEELGLERLDSDVIEYNERSLALYTKKCGWRIEGVRKGWYYRAGKRWDKILIGITREEFLSGRGER